MRLKNIPRLDQRSTRTRQHGYLGMFSLRISKQFHITFQQNTRTETEGEGRKKVGRNGKVKQKRRKDEETIATQRIKRKASAYLESDRKKERRREDKKKGSKESENGIRLLFSCHVRNVSKNSSMNTQVPLVACEEHGLEVNTNKSEQFVSLLQIAEQNLNVKTANKLYENF